MRVCGPWTGRFPVWRDVQNGTQRCCTVGPWCRPQCAYEANRFRDSGSSRLSGGYWIVTFTTNTCGVEENSGSGDRVFGVKAPSTMNL